MVFEDRRDAGRQLARRLMDLKQQQPVVLALPRGGVPVGFEIARAVSAPLDIILVRKIGAPFEPELAVGAIVGGDDPEPVIDARMVADLNVSPEYLEAARGAALREIERRRLAYLGTHLPVEVEGRTAIVVDDGIATGATMLAALGGTRRRRPARIVLAVPVASEQALTRLRPEVDRTICLTAPADFGAVGAFYRQFPQLTDQEVVTLLDSARAITSAGKSAAT